MDVNGTPHFPIILPLLQGAAHATDQTGGWTDPQGQSEMWQKKTDVCPHGTWKLIWSTQPVD
jgi:hypothetical protein